MSQINFLPESFRRSRRRQQRRPVEFLVIAGTIIALAGLWLSTSGPDSALARQCDELDRCIETIAEMQSEQQRLNQERSALQRRLMTARETYQPISVTQILSRISALAPEPVRLVHVEVSAQRPTPEPKPAAETTQRQVVGQSNAAKQVEPNLMQVTIIGHAPSDEQLVTLIRQMDADPVFTLVSLLSSRQDQTRTHFVRTFHLEVLIDLDRRFISSEGGKADAD